MALIKPYDLCSVDQRGAYVDMGGKQPLFCPINEASVCKLQKVTGTLHAPSQPFELLF